MFLVVGAGICGAVIAECLARVLQKKVLVLERRNHIAGNVYDYVDPDSNIMVHKYGPHVFHTDDTEVWHHLCQFTDWHPYFHKVQAIVNGNAVNLPVNLETLGNIFPGFMAEKIAQCLIDEYGYGKQVTVTELAKHNNPDIAFCGEFLYEKIYVGYTCKQWGIEPDKLDPSVLARVPFNIDTDNRYFKDKYQGIPLHGYTKMLEKILDHPLIEVKTGTAFSLNHNYPNVEAVVYTGPVDELFGWTHGVLPYRSLKFELRTYDIQLQSVAQVNYPENYDYTRITEFRHFLPGDYTGSLLAFEYPLDYKPDCNEPFYPVQTDAGRKLFLKYRNDADALHGFYLTGRLGLYKYLNMDQAVRAGLDVAQQIISEY